MSAMKNFLHAVMDEMGVDEATPAVLAEAQYRLEHPAREIHVNLDPDRDPENQGTPYRAVVLEWGYGPTFWFNPATDRQEIMPGTEKGGWHNAGVVCWAATPTEAFHNALLMAEERWGVGALYPSDIPDYATAQG